MPEDKPVHVRREPSYPGLDYSAISSPIFEPESDEINIREYWNIFISRRWTILAIIVTCAAIGFIWTMRQTPIYRASTTVQIDPENSNILTFQDVYKFDAAREGLTTQYEILKSRVL